MLDCFEFVTVLATIWVFLSKKDLQIVLNQHYLQTVFNQGVRVTFLQKHFFGIV